MLQDTAASRKWLSDYVPEACVRLYSSQSVSFITQHFILHFSGNKLTLDDLGQVLEEVLDVSAQWYHLGIQLELKVGTLDSISAQFTDPKHQLLEILKTWLTTSDNTSWRTLTDALRSRNVGASELSGILETKYCLVEETQADSSNSAYGVQPETPVDIGTSAASDSWPETNVTSTSISQVAIEYQISSLVPGRVKGEKQPCKMISGQDILYK